jgi:hypothetical protein
MATTDTRPTGSASAADAALADILDEIGVPRPVLTEARNRRDLVLDIAMEHEAARARYVSGSVARHAQSPSRGHGLRHQGGSPRTAIPPVRA